MRTERIKLAQAMGTIGGIRFHLVCKILEYEFGNSLAVDALMSIAQIDEKELCRLKELINGMFSEAKKQAIKKALKENGQENSPANAIDVMCLIEDDIEDSVKSMITFIQDEEQEQAMEILAHICSRVHDEQNREQQLEAIRERINLVFEHAHELRLKKFLRLSKAIAEAAMPFENGKPIAELKEITTEVIRFVRTCRLGQKGLKWYMDLGVFEIYTYREMREYQEFWEHAEYASPDETVELICQAIQRIENKVKANFDFEQDEIKVINEMIKVSLFEAGVQQDTSEWSERFKDLIEIFAKQGILYRGSAEQYGLCLEISKKFKL